MPSNNVISNDALERHRQVRAQKGTVVTVPSIIFEMSEEGRAYWLSTLSEDQSVYDYSLLWKIPEEDFSEPRE